MGKVLSILPRTIATRYNIENRAHKVISKDKPTAAPKYPGTVRDLERFVAEHPDFIKEQSMKDSGLDNRLKDIYVLSHDPVVTKTENNKENPKRPLPLNRKPVDYPEMGFVESEKIPIGKVSLRNAMHFIGHYQSDSKTWNINRISQEHKLSNEVVENIVTHFRTFEVYLPDKKGINKKELTATPKENKQIEE